MLRKYISAILVAVILIHTGGFMTFAQSQKVDKSAKKIEKLKMEIAKLGTGKEAKVVISLANGSKVKGYVSQVNENSFVVTNESSGATTEIQFSDVNKLAGRNMSTGTKIAIGFGIAAVALLLLVFIGLHYAD